MERVNYMMSVYIISSMQRIANGYTKVLLFSKVLIHYKIKIETEAKISAFHYHCFYGQTNCRICCFAMSVLQNNRNNV